MNTRMASKSVCLYFICDSLYIYVCVVVNKIEWGTDKVNPPHAAR